MAASPSEPACPRRSRPTPPSAARADWAASASTSPSPTNRLDLSSPTVRWPTVSRRNRSAAAAATAGSLSTARSISAATRHQPLALVRGRRRIVQPRPGFQRRSDRHQWRGFDRHLRAIGWRRRWFGRLCRCAQCRQRIDRHQYGRRLGRRGGQRRPGHGHQHRAHSYLRR